MFVVNEDNSIYATRGDIVFFSVTAEDKGVKHTFKAGDVLRIKVYGKKNAEDVVLQKDFPVTEDTEMVEIFLTEEDTKIGDVISKPKDYWYEVELNPLNNPQTIIGYDEDGARVFKLFPEGDDIPEYVPSPEDVAVMDDELDMTSTRPVENQAVARAVVSLRADFDKTNALSNETANALSVERSRIDNLIAHDSLKISQNLDYLDFITETTKAKIDGRIESDGVHATIKVNLREANLIYGGTDMDVFIIPDECRPIDTGLIHTADGMEYRINYDTTRKSYVLNFSATASVAPSGAGTVNMTYALGDYELKDIRIGADGKSYPTAGAAIREQIKGLAEDSLSDFAKHGGSDKYLSNVEIYTDEYEHILISDIRNGYNGSVGFSVFSCDANGENYVTIRAVHELEITQKRVKIPFGTNSVLILDFDVSEMAEGTRYTDVGLKSMVKPSCIFSRTIYNEINEVKNRVDSLVAHASIGLFEKMGVIGDSFASGEIYLKQTDGTYIGKDYYNLSWGQIVAREHGMSCKNYSAGGLTTRTWLTSNKGLPLLLADEPQQLYVFALGINDVYKLGLDYLGTINDITAKYVDNPDTFYGNYGRIIEQVKAHAPNGKLILSTLAETRWNCTAYNDAIINIAEHYGIPCIKQYEDEFFNTAFYKDHQVQGHPISVVYSGMAKAITRLIEKTMVIHYGYFNNYVG